jgi:hypothetical protein
MRRSTRILLLALLAATTTITQPSARALQVSSCNTDDIASAIVGRWRGQAVYVHARKYFVRVDTWFRFTDYGVVEFYRGPVANQDGFVEPSLRTRGDYLVVGHSIMLRLDSLNGPVGATVTGVRVTCDRLEFVEATGTTALLGGGFVLARE